MFVVCFLVGTQNFFFVSCLPCQRGYHNVHVMDKRMRFLLLDLLIIYVYAGVNSLNNTQFCRHKNDWKFIKFFKKIKSLFSQKISYRRI